MASKTEELQALVTLFGELTKKAKASGNALEKALESKGQPKSLAQLKEMETEIEAIARETKELNAIKKQEITLDSKLQSVRKGNQDQILKTRAAINEETKAIRDRIKESKSVTPLYDKEKKRLAELQKQLAETALRTGATSKETRKLAKETQFLNNKINKAEQIGGKYQSQVGKYPKLMAGSILAFAGAAVTIGAFTRGISNAIGIAKDFEQSNANLASVLGVSRSEIGALTEDAKRLGAATSFSASEVSGLQTEFAKLGFNESEILNATEATLNLAAATGSDLGEAAAIAGATLGGFGLGAEETARVTDVMAKSFSTSALDMEKFKESMKTAAPAAKAVGKSVEETTALLGTLSNAGISGSKAGTSLKTTFINLNAAGLTMNEGFEKVNNSSDKLGTAVKLVGKEAAAAFLVLADGADDTAMLQKGLENAGGAAEKMANEQLDTLEGSLKILNSAWEGFVLGLLSGEGAFSSISRSMVGFATSVLGVLTPSQELSETWFRQRDEVEALESKILPLADRYDELAEKSELSKNEQEELDGIIQQIAEDVPEAATAFDEYGKVIGISTDATRELIKQSKDLLALDNAEAIKEQEEAISDLEDSLENLNIKYRVRNGVLNTYNSELKTFLKADAEEIVAFGKKGQAIRSEIELREAKIALLKGEKTAAELAKEEEDKLRKLNEEQITTLNTLNAELSELKKLRGDINVENKEELAINRQLIKDKQKEIDLIEGKIKKQKESNAELNNQKRRIELIEDAEDKAVAKEKLRFEQALISAEKNNEDLQLVEEVHLKKMQEIRDKFETKRREIEIEDRDSRRKLNTTAGNDALKEAERLGKIQDEKEADRLKRQKELREAAFTVADKLLKDSSDKRVKALDDEFDALKNNQSKLEDLASQGNENAVKSLAISQKKQAEITAQKEKELKRQAQLELVLAGFKTYTAKVEAGDPNPLGSTITDTTVLLAALSSLDIGAFEKGGLIEGGEQIVRVNEKGSEFVLDAPTTKKLGLDRSGSDMTDFNKIMFNKDLSKVPEPPRFQSNEEVLAKHDEMIKALTKMPRKIDGTGYYDSAILSALEKVNSNLSRNDLKGYSIFD